jgi:hypothetical protein
MRLRRRSPRIPPAGPTAPRCRRAGAPKPPASAGSRSTTCAARASGCSTARGAWACPSARSSATTAPGSPSGCAAPQYRPTLVDPYRDYLRQRRAEEPGASVQQLLREIRERGYPGSSNLLVRYLNQGRADSERPHLAPRKATQILLTRPDNLADAQRETAGRLASACPEMKALASLITSFAAMLTPDPANEDKLLRWIAAARAADLPHLHSFTRGLDLDLKAATAAFTLPYHNGRTEGVNTKTKKIKRDMFGRAGFELLRHRILLGLGHVSPPPDLRQSRFIGVSGPGR